MTVAALPRDCDGDWHSTSAGPEWDSIYWLLAMLCYFACAVAAGTIMARLIELPVIARRDRLLPARASAVNPPGVAAVSA